MSTIPPATPDDAPRRWSRRLGVAYGVVVTGLLLTIVGLMAWSPLQGRSGLWAHATIGRWIWETGTIPDRTLLLWTASEPYVYHSWLAQLLIFGLTTIGDGEYLAYVAWAFTTLLAVLPFVFIAIVWHRCSRLSAWMVIPLLLGVKAISVRFDTRPELFTGVCLGLLLMFLVTWSGTPGSTPAAPLRRRDKLALAGVVLMFVAWANLHGAVILGIVVLGVTAACDLVQDRARPRSIALAVAVPLALAVVCVNPYGLSYFSTFARVQSFAFAHIIEWRPIWRNPPVLGQILPTAGVVAVLAFAAWLMNPQRRWAQLAWLLLLGAFFAQARRNIWPFTLTALMVLAANAGAVNFAALRRMVSRFVPNRAAGKEAGPIRIRPLFLAGLLAWLVLDASLLVLDLQTWRPLLPTDLEGVARFMRENDLSGRLFNDYENSGYLQWSLRGRPPLYLDMMDSYPDQVMRDYQAIVQMTERGSQLLDEQQIEVVVLTTNRTGQSLAALAQHLDGRPQWVRVFANRAGVIWVRRSPTYEPIWGPRSAAVSPVEFAVLERNGDETAMLVPPIVEDIGRGKQR
jgi:hypothetical protein